MLPKATIKYTALKPGKPRTTIKVSNDGEDAVPCLHHNDKAGSVLMPRTDPTEMPGSISANLHSLHIDEGGDRIQQILSILSLIAFYAEGLPQQTQM